MKYELIIKEIESGEVVSQRECDTVIGATAGKIADGAIAVGSLSLHSGEVIVAMSAISGAENSVEHMKTVICDDFKKNCEAEISYDELASFVEKASARIEANTDAIEKMIGGEEQ